MSYMTEMNLISRILIGALVIAVFAVVWYLLTRRNGKDGGCSGDCSGCSAQCGRRKE